MPQTKFQDFVYTLIMAFLYIRKVRFSKKLNKYIDEHTFYMIHLSYEINN